jgi:Predicted signal transduction protein with a C-terminal ATPase domain
VKIFDKKSKLQKQIIQLYIFLAVIPISIVTIAASRVYYESLLEKSYSLIEQNARQHEVVINERMESYKNVLYELVTNKEYTALAQAINMGEESALIVNKLHMETLLRRSVYNYNAIRSVVFLTDNGDYVFYSKWYRGVDESIWQEAAWRKEIHDKMEAVQTLTFTETMNLSNTTSRSDYVILMGYPVKDLRSKQQSGVLVIALEEEVWRFDDLAMTAEESGITTVVLDSDDRILTGVESSYINEKYQTYLETEFGDNNQIREMRNAVEGSKWVIVNIIDTAVYKQEINSLIKGVLIFMVVVTLLFFTIIYLVSGRYIEKIQLIVKGIYNYEIGSTNDSTFIVDMNPDDDLYAIANSFNKMTVRVNLLVEELKRRNEVIRRATISQKHAEIKALEAQINPHFLYNTLDSINWRAIEHEEEEISDMLGALGSLMRYSISNIDILVFLEAEIEWLKKYIFLQKDRFQNSFDCQYDISEEALQFPIYKMLMQPLIENAILHAFAEVKESGMIYVKSFVQGDGRLLISIRDNGCGMSEELLRKINAEIGKNKPLNSERIGISNVIHRIRIYYKEVGDIIVNSKLGEGTEFILIVPNGQKE